LARQIARTRPGGRCSGANKLAWPKGSPKESYTAGVGDGEEVSGLETAQTPRRQVNIDVKQSINQSINIYFLTSLLQYIFSHAM
jgi:hypothetical protein